MAEFTVGDVIEIQLNCLQRWIDKIDVPEDEQIKQQWVNFFTFTPPDSFLRLVTVMPPEFGFSLGYQFQFIEPRECMMRTFCYTECFREFYASSELIPILDHGSGRNYDLYDCKTGAVIQFNVIDSPSEWIVLAPSFDETALEYYHILRRINDEDTAPPESIYDSDGKEFKTLLEVFPDRARELDGILPEPLVLRTHQPGTWQIDKMERIHEIIQNSVSDDITELKAHLEAHPEDIRRQTSKKSEPLHEVCRLGRLNCLEYLLQRIQEEGGIEGLKIALSARDNSLRTPLLIACENLRENSGVAKCLDRILSCGPEIVDVNCAQDEGQTALHFVSSSGYPYFVKKLLDLGANVNHRDDDKYGGNTPLHSLCRIRGGAYDDQGAGRLSACSLSISHAFEPTEKSCIYSMQLLVNAGADVNAPSIGQNSTPLHLLMWGSGMEDCTKMIELLCENGADVNAKTNLGVSVLESGFAREKYLDVLIKFGAVDEGNKRKYTTKTFTKTFTSEDKPQPVLKTANAVMGMTANEAVEKANVTGKKKKNKKLGK